MCSISFLRQKALKPQAQSRTMQCFAELGGRDNQTSLNINIQQHSDALQWSLSRSKEATKR